MNDPLPSFSHAGQPVSADAGPQAESENFAINTIRGACEPRPVEEENSEGAMEGLYRKIVETTNEGISIIDSSFRYSFVNRQMAMMLGYEPEEMIGRDIMEFQFPENLNRKRQILEHRREGVREHYEDRLRRKDGSELWVRIAATPIYKENGVFDGALAMMNDITERKRAEEALRESEDRFRRAAQAGRMFAYEWDMTTDQIVQSQEAAEILGLSGDATHTTGREVMAMIHPDDRRRVNDSIEGPTLENPIYRNVIRVFRLDGRMIWLERFGRVFFDAQGKMVRRVGMAMDVTERKRAEEALRESEERFRFAAQAGRMFAYEWDMTTDRIVRSPECAEILGLTGDVTHTTGQEVAASIHPEDLKLVAAAVAGLTPENSIYRATVRVFRPDGDVVWLERTGRGFFNAEGKLSRLIGMAVDVTEHKRTEEALRGSEEQFRSVFREAGVGMVIVLPDGRFLAANNAFCEYVGYTEGELLSKTVQSITHPEDWPHFSRKLGETLAQGVSFQKVEKRCLHKSGRIVWGESSASLIRGPGGEPRYFIGEVLDITERKLAEETLRESEEKFRSVFRDAGVGMKIFSPEGHFLAANGAFCECVGYSEEELLQRNIESIIHPEDWPAFSRVLGEALAHGPGFQKVERRYVHKSGRIIWGECSASLIRSPGGEPRYFVGELLDTTERKLAEEARSSVNRRLIEAQEEERARIARDLHDDINQRLALLAMGIGQVKKASPGFPAELFGRMDELSRQTAEIAADIQAISHQLHSSKLGYLGIVAAMEGFCEESAEQQKVEIHFSHDSVPSEVPQEISLCLFRVLQEALHNALKHSGVRHFEVQLYGASDEIGLSVCDLGVGFDPNAALNQRGLGLISMRERLRLVQGSIAIESKPQCGTRIHALVPLGRERRAMSATG